MERLFGTGKERVEGCKKDGVRAAVAKNQSCPNRFQSPPHIPIRAYTLALLSGLHRIQETCRSQSLVCERVSTFAVVLIP